MSTSKTTSQPARKTTPFDLIMTGIIFLVIGGGLSIGMVKNIPIDAPYWLTILLWIGALCLPGLSIFCTIMGITGYREKRSEKAP